MAHAADLVDAAPLRNVVLCCTSLSKDIRTEIASVASELGALHILDLTLDTTHLLVGNIHTPKYRYVAKSRPDIRVLRPEFINAVREKWVQGGDVDVDALEEEYKYPAFQGLQICITGFEAPDERKRIEREVERQGARYHCDLTKEVTHLIAARCEGAKYTHAKHWGISVVSHKWLEDSLERGMMLEEGYYAPEMPVNEQGVGAFKALPVIRDANRRKRGGDDTTAENIGKRKLRRVASRRLESQSQDMWQGISAREESAATIDAWRDESTEYNTVQAVRAPQVVAETSRRQGILSGHYVIVHGFQNDRADRLKHFLEPNGAVVVAGPEELEQASIHSDYQAGILLVPHDYDEAHLLLQLPPNTQITTEWWLECCIQEKTHIDPGKHALHRPLGRLRRSELPSLSVNCTGMMGVELRQAASAIKLMGATYQEHLLPSTSVLVCASAQIRKEKAIYATKHKIPVVTADWLWTCLKTGRKPDLEGHLHPAATFKSDSSSREGEQVAALAANGTRVDENHPKRLSNVRRRYATPALALETFQTVRPHKGPFILEDYNSQEMPSVVDGASPVPVLPLQEISPNASPLKSQHAPPQKVEHSSGVAHEAGLDIISLIDRDGEGEDENAGTVASECNRTRSITAEENISSRPNDHEQLTGQLASIIARQAARSASPNVQQERLRRKNRPLGRNLSGVSSRSNTASSNHLAAPLSPGLFHEDSYEIADGFTASKEAPFPPGTQLGYDTPEAEAHRAQLSRKMGVKLAEDDTLYSGKREERVGTVRDRVRRGGHGQRRRAPVVDAGGGVHVKTKAKG